MRSVQRSNQRVGVNYTESRILVVVVGRLKHSMRQLQPRYR
jgi:hypothetical protein